MSSRSFPVRRPGPQQPVEPWATGERSLSCTVDPATATGRQVLAG